MFFSKGGAWGMGGPLDKEGSWKGYLTNCVAITVYGGLGTCLFFILYNAFLNLGNTTEVLPRQS